MNLARSARRAWADETHLPSPAAVGAHAADPGAARAVLALRRATGALAFALPVLVVVVDLFLPNLDWHVRDSLSAYYFAGSRELFTGGLAATGALLLAYKAFDRRLEFWLTSVAGALGILVAFFPTEQCATCGATTPLQQALGADVVRDLHYSAATAMIALLAVVCILWAALEQHTGIGAARFRSLHIASAAVIGVAVCFGAAMLAAGPLFDQELLVVEWVSVWSFALSWLSIGPAYAAREAARAHGS